MTRQARDVGILFADIAGSMRLYEAFGNRGALAAIEMCLGVIGNVVNVNKGFVVKTIGDEIMACFPDPVETWNAAVECQKKVEALPPLPGAQGDPVKMGLRVGFDYGQAIETNGDFFGGTVNMAARMVQLAKRGQIITTGENETRLGRGHRFHTRGLDWLPVKGKPNGVQVVEVLWKDDGGERSTVIGLSSFPDPRTAVNALTLRLGFTEWTFDGTCASVSVGREPVNDVVIPASSASRNHATIERRRDRWVLIDHSSNGTFVRSPTEGEMHLRREELILGREGTIGFGHPTAHDPNSCVTFAVARAGG